MNGQTLHLAIDVGNTSAHLALFNSSRLLRTPERPSRAILGSRDLPCVRILEDDEWTGRQIRSLLRQSPALSQERAGENAPRVLLASVNPPVSSLLKNRLRAEFGLKVKQVPRDLPIPIPSSVQSPARVGADRLLACFASLQRWKPPLVVVSCGTAITVNVVDRRGVFRGGAILPGLELAADTLARCALLPKISPSSRIPRATGRNTQEAIRAGVLYGSAGALREVLRQMRKEHLKLGTIVATGRDAPKLARLVPEIRHVAPHLVLEGLLWAALLQESSQFR